MKNLLYVLLFTVLFIGGSQAWMTLIGCQNAPVVKLVDTLKTPPQYTRIKRGMETAFMNALMPESEMQETIDNTPDLSSEGRTEQMNQFLKEKQETFEMNFIDGKPLNIDNDNPDSIYYLNYTLPYKQAIIHLKKVDQFLE